jgi:hypothetical protein
MKRKVLIDPRRKRRIPPHFSWIDHRLIRDGVAKKCKIEAMGLYLFLVAVSDSDGLSFYGEKRISEELNCSVNLITSLRSELITAGLIAYREGIYQILDLEIQVPESSVRPDATGFYRAGDIANKIVGGFNHG